MDLSLDGEPVDEDHSSVWVPSARGRVSGLFGLNVVLLGAALLASRALTEQDVLTWEPQLMLLLLIGFSVAWILWFLLYHSRKPGSCPHKDHHAGGVTVKLVLLLFAGLSLLLCMFRMGFMITMKSCKQMDQLVSPVLQAVFIGLQTYFLWAHSKDCIHFHKIITRAGLMLTLCADLLLWLNAVTDDTIHQEIELEEQDGITPGNHTYNIDVFDTDMQNNNASCICSNDTACMVFRKGFEVLYPFIMEYFLMAGCMVYVMWRNVGRPLATIHNHIYKKLTLKIMCRGGIIYGLIFGTIFLIAGITVFILYQVFVAQAELRFTAFVLFYSYHLVVMPIMSLCSLLGLLVHRCERRAHEGGHNPTRSLDIMLLIAAAIGQLVLSYFSLIAALAVGTKDILGELDLSYSVLSLIELVLQNIFIIEGLHRHPNLKAKKKEKQRSTLFKLKKKSTAQEERKADFSLVDGNTTAPPADPKHDGTKTWTKTVIREICAFLLLSNIMLWVIPAFGVHPQFENGLGKQFLGFSCWFILVNMGQPLTVFYRMHSVWALMELMLNP